VAVDGCTPFCSVCSVSVVASVAVDVDASVDVAIVAIVTEQEQQFSTDRALFGGAPRFSAKKYPSTANFDQRFPLGSGTGNHKTLDLVKCTSNGLPLLAFHHCLSIRSVLFAANCCWKE